jgi:hypothetical protein
VPQQQRQPSAQQAGSSDGAGSGSGGWETEEGATRQQWDAGSIDRGKCEQAVVASMQGDYLVRKSASSNGYVLCVHDSGQAINYTINVPVSQPSKFEFTGSIFDRLEDVISYTHNTPLKSVVRPGKRLLIGHAAVIEPWLDTQGLGREKVEVKVAAAPHGTSHSGRSIWFNAKVPCVSFAVFPCVCCFPLRLLAALIRVRVAGCTRANGHKVPAHVPVLVLPVSWFALVSCRPPPSPRVHKRNSQLRLRMRILVEPPLTLLHPWRANTHAPSPVARQHPRTLTRGAGDFMVRLSSSRDKYVLVVNDQGTACSCVASPPIHHHIAFPRPLLLPYVPPAFSYLQACYSGCIVPMLFIGSFLRRCTCVVAATPPPVFTSHFSIYLAN